MTHISTTADLSNPPFTLMVDNIRYKNASLRPPPLYTTAYVSDESLDYYRLADTGQFDMTKL